jgi:hypothetical protein
MSIAAGTLPAPADPLAPVTDKHTDERWYPYPPDPARLFESVTWLIAGTNSKPWFARWHGSTSTAWCVDHLGLLARTKRTEGRDAAIALGKDEATRLRDIKADTGTFLHDVGEALILWATERKDAQHHVPYPELPDHLREAMYDDEPVPVIAARMADGWVQFVSDFGLRPGDFLACEMQVYDPEREIAGTLDTIIAFRGLGICGDPRTRCHLGAFCPGKGTHIIAAPGEVLPVCIDFKTGKSPEGTWKEQLAAYRRMPECRPDKIDTALVPTPKTRAGAVLHLRPEYPGGYLLQLVSAGDDEEAWERFLASIDLLRGRQACKDKPGTSIRPPRPDGTMPGLRLCDLAAEGYGRALSPLRNALGADCELAALAEFTEADVLAIKRVGPKLIETIREMLAAHGLSLADDPARAGKAA